MRLFLFASLLLLAPGTAVFAQDLYIQGSATIAPIITSAVKDLKEINIEPKLLPEGGSSLAIYQVGRGDADVALSVRGVTAQDRAAFPAKSFEEFILCYQVLVPVVSNDVWESGVRRISKTQFRALYEGEMKTWKDLGGEDRGIRYFNPEQGKGNWEMFVTWLYGDPRKAPLGNFEIVTSQEETKNLLDFTGGAIALLSPSRVGGNVHALELVDDDGSTLKPDHESIRSKRYPLSRPLYLVVGSRPAGHIRKFVEYMTGPVGQKLVQQFDFLPAEGR